MFRLPVSVLLIMGPIIIVAQTPTVCEGTDSHASSVAHDQQLREAGYALSRNSLAQALGDHDPDVRWLAAEELAERFGQAELAALTQTWVVEKDFCAAGRMYVILVRLMQRVAWDTAQHPGGQPRVTPFRTCAASAQPLVSMTIERVADPFYGGPAIEIRLRNQTAQPVPFAKTISPTEIVSATVLDPTGAHARVTTGQEWMYAPLQRSNVANDGSYRSRSGSFNLSFRALQPNEDVSWIWRIGDDFDLSLPGTYAVSLGGRIDYLDTTFCSNTLSVTVEK
jgi:hypothetical protein